MQLVKTGITRWVLLIGPFAIKFPKSLRGYLANQSEWRQRKRPRVNRPIISLFHLMIVFYRATEIGKWEPKEFNVSSRYWYGIEYSNEEAKGESWGLVKNCWVLIDFDRAWENPRPVIGLLYYWNQARLARKWMNLPFREETDG